jgi:Leucine-rich repeat (LRR) protein
LDGRSKPGLRTVELDGNDLYGGVSAPMTSNLRVFTAAGNRLSSAFDDGLGLHPSSAPGLQQVELSGNPLGSSLPASLASSAALQRLVLDRTGLVGSLPSFAQATSLASLSVAGNHLVGDTPQLPPSLQLLNLAGNQLTGFLPSALTDSAAFPNLTYINVAGNNLSIDLGPQLLTSPVLET